MAYVQTTADETANALTVRIFKEGDTGAMEAVLLPMPHRLVECLRRHAVYTSDAFANVSDVKTVLVQAVGLQTSAPDIEGVHVQLCDGIEWDDAWGDLVRTNQR